MNMISLSKPNIGQAEIDAVSAVLTSGQLIQGPQVAAFENAVAEYVGAKHAVAVSSGTAALHLALIAVGIGPGDAVIVPNFTFVATANAVALVGAKPIFVDVSATTFCMEPESVELAIRNWSGREKIVALMPVFEFGHPVNIAAFRHIANHYGLALIGDAACAIGAIDSGERVGTGSSLTCFSFHPRKTLTTGEGGMITTNDAMLANKIRLLRNHGIDSIDSRRLCVTTGFNYRMTDVAAAMGLVQLTHLDESIKQRRALAACYEQHLKGIEGIQCPPMVDGHSWQSYMILLDDSFIRDEIIERLRVRGVQAGIGAQSIVDQPAYKNYLTDELANWESRRLYAQGLVLPFCESYTEKEVAFVAATLLEILS